MHQQLGPLERVLPVLAAYEDDDDVHVISPLCEQENALEFLLAQGTVTHVLVATLMRDVLSALTSCHSHGKTPLLLADCDEPNAGLMFAIATWDCEADIFSVKAAASSLQEACCPETDVQACVKVWIPHLAAMRCLEDFATRWTAHGALHWKWIRHQGNGDVKPLHGHWIQFDQVCIVFLPAAAAAAVVAAAGHVKNHGPIAAVSKSRDCMCPACLHACLLCCFGLHKACM